MRYDATQNDATPGRQALDVNLTGVFVGAPAMVPCTEGPAQRVHRVYLTRQVELYGHLGQARCIAIRAGHFAHYEQAAESNWLVVAFER